MTRDTFKGTNVGAMGPNATAHGTTFVQSPESGLEGINLDELVLELARLRPEMRKLATKPEHDEAIAAIGRAEAAAASGQKSELISYLTSAGSWAAGVAAKISASVVAKLILENLKE